MVIRDIDGNVKEVQVFYQGKVYCDAEIIYKATNRIDGKSYIGRTGRDIVKRIQGHFSSREFLGRNIRKYGSENFDWEILVRCYCLEKEKHGPNEWGYYYTHCSTRTASLIEKYFMLEYNTYYPHGYNVIIGVVEDDELERAKRLIKVFRGFDKNAILPSKLIIPERNGQGNRQGRGPSQIHPRVIPEGNVNYIKYEQVGSQCYADERLTNIKEKKIHVAG